MDLAYRLQTYLQPNPPAEGEGLGLALWQGKGAAATPEAVAANLARLEEVAAITANHGAHLLALPELYLSGYSLTPKLARQLAEPVDGPSLKRVAATARRHGLAVLALLGAQLVVIPTAAESWARLSDGRLTDRPYPDISRTLIPAPLRTAALWPMPTAAARRP
jgi:hypothetical protein